MASLLTRRLAPTVFDTRVLALDGLRRGSVVMNHGTGPRVAQPVSAATSLPAYFPVVFFPVMNDEMWNKPAVKRNIAQLREDGYHVNEPVWADRYDIGSGTVLNDPTLPPPPMVTQVVGELLS